MILIGDLKEDISYATNVAYNKYKRVFINYKQRELNDFISTMEKDSRYKIYVSYFKPVFKAYGIKPLSADEFVLETLIVAIHNELSDKETTDFFKFIDFFLRNDAKTFIKKMRISYNIPGVINTLSDEKYRKKFKLKEAYHNRLFLLMKDTILLNFAYNNNNNVIMPKIDKEDLNFEENLSLVLVSLEIDGFSYFERVKEINNSRTSKFARRRQSNYQKFHKPTLIISQILLAVISIIFIVLNGYVIYGVAEIMNNGQTLDNLTAGVVIIMSFFSLALLYANFVMNRNVSYHR